MPEEQFIMATRSAEIVFVKIERAAVIEKSTYYTVLMEEEYDRLRRRRIAHSEF